MDFTKDQISIENEKKIIDTMSNIWTKECILIWGEPTLHKGILEIVKYWVSKWLFMKIITNWRRYSNMNFVEQLKDIWLWFTAISIHWTTEEEHFKNTQSKNSFKQTLEWIKNCIKVWLPFITLSTINYNNKDNIVNIACFLNSIWVNNIVYNLASPVEGIDVNSNILNPQILSEAIQNAYFILKKKNIKVKFYSSIPLCVYDKNVILEMLNDWYLMPLNWENMSDCNVYDGSWIAIDPKWNILLCTHEVISPVEKILDKNLLYKDENEVMKILQVVKWMIWLDNWNYPSKICNDCSMKEKCIWGCPLYWRTFETKKLINNIFC